VGGLMTTAGKSPSDDRLVLGCLAYYINACEGARFPARCPLDPGTARVGLGRPQTVGLQPESSESAEQRPNRRMRMYRVASGHIVISPGQLG
jgi:hypothetical protein